MSWSALAHLNVLALFKQDITKKPLFNGSNLDFIVILEVYVYRLTNKNFEKQKLNIKKFVDEANFGQA